MFSMSGSSFLSTSPSSSPDPTSATSRFFTSVPHHGRNLAMTSLSNLAGDGVRTEKCGTSFGKCFMYTLQGFFSGSDQTEGEKYLSTCLSYRDFLLGASFS